MDHCFLVPILVFLQAVFPPASAAGTLPPPEISVDPKRSPYFEGENILLSCVAKINKTVSGYRFFSRNGSMFPEMTIDGFWTGMLSVTVPSQNETYSCEYWRKDNSDEVLSQRSSPIKLKVKEAPQKPSLTLNHKLSEYKWGDNVSLVCLAPPTAKNIMEFQYFGERQTIQTLKPSNNTVIYNMSIFEPKNMGKFRCAYIQDFAGQLVRSKESDPVYIDLADSNSLLHASLGRILTTGGAFFTINGFIFFITHCYLLPKVS